MWFLYKFAGIVLLATFGLWITWKVVSDRVLPKDPPAAAQVSPIDRYRD